jgi:hypothetical protein
MRCQINRRNRSIYLIFRLTSAEQAEAGCMVMVEDSDLQQASGREAATLVLVTSPHPCPADQIHVAVERVEKGGEEEGS